MTRLIVPIEYKPAISIEHYRELTGDTNTSDKLVIQRIFYIERLCRGVIKQELQKTARG